MHPPLKGLMRKELLLILGILPAITSTAISQSKTGKEAEELFGKIEDQLRNAKTVEVVVSSELKDDRSTTRQTNRLLLGEGNKFRWRREVQMTIKSLGEGSPKLWDRIFDGKTLCTLGKDGKAVVPDRKIPGDLRVEFTSALLREGTYGPQDLLELLEFNEPLPKSAGKAKFTMSALELGPREKVGAVDCQVLRYELRKSEDSSSKHTLWVSLSNSLPVKREIVWKDRSGTSTESETYPTFALNKSIEPKEFVVPGD